MQKSNFIYATIGSVLVTSGIYLANDGDNDSSTIKKTEPIRHSVQAKTELLVTGSNYSVKGDIKSEKEKLLELLSMNIQLKNRILGTSWYRDFIVGNLSIEIFQRYLDDAESIERLLISNPGIINSIQYEQWWRAYLSGEITPDIIRDVELGSFLRINKLRIQSPVLYEQIQHNPAWNNSNNTLADKKMLLEITLEQSRFIDENPRVKERMSKFGLSQNDLYKSSHTDSIGITEIDAIFFIENPQSLPNEIGAFFWNSPIGKLYEEGKINPKEAYNFIINSQEYKLAI